jgi:hypothetical protein
VSGHKGIASLPVLVDGKEAAVSLYPPLIPFPPLMMQVVGEDEDDEMRTDIVLDFVT